MTLPGRIPFHVHVSEREVAHTWPDGRRDDAAWEDCLWCSIVEWLNDTWKDVPDTLSYAEQLRAASGEVPTGGSNYGDVQRAFDKKGIPIHLEPLAFPAFWAALIPGTAGSAAGSMGNFPKGHRLRRWDPTFASGHSVEVSRVDSSARVWWCDPLAPKGTYQGEWVTQGELRQYMGSAWTGVVRRLRALPATTVGVKDVPTLSQYAPGQVAVVKATANVRAEPKLTSAPIRVVSSPESWAITGWVKGDVDPEGGSDQWITRWNAGKWEYTAKSNISSGPAAPAGASPDAALTAKVQALEASLKQAAAVERERIANAVGATAANQIRNT